MYLSSAAASALIAGPRDRIVSSTRSRRSDCLGLRSSETSTSILIAFWSSFSSLASLAAACCRKRDGTVMWRPLTMISIVIPFSA